MKCPYCKAIVIGNKCPKCRAETPKKPDIKITEPKKNIENKEAIINE